MTQPEYFSFICSEILNIQIFPTQALILCELWNRRFPMLIATRGFGKSFTLALYALLRILLLPNRKIVIAGAAFRQSKIIFDYMEAIYKNAPLLRDLLGPNDGPRRDVDTYRFHIKNSIAYAIPIGDGSKIRGLRANDVISDEFACLKAGTLVETDNGLIRIENSIGQDIKLINEVGEFESPQKFIVTPPTEQYEITTTNGYSFTCSKIHSVKTINRGFVLAKDLTKKDYLIIENRYIFPTKQIHILDNNLAWLFGILTSEGAISGKYQMIVKMTDKNCIDRIGSAWNKFDNKLHLSFSEKEAYIDNRGWKCKKSYNISVCSKSHRDYFEYLGLDKDIAINKKIPWSILQSPREVVTSYLSGLFEGDGSAFLWKDKKNKKSLGVCFYSSSQQLCKEVQTILLKLGFSSYINSRISKISKNLQYFVRLNGQEAFDFAQSLNIKKWQATLDKCVISTNKKGWSITFDKSRNKWKATVLICGKNKYLGRFETENQAKSVAISNLPQRHIRVQNIIKLDEVDILYDYYLPKTNSFYGNGFIQHNSIPKAIFETVLAGFAVVKPDPVNSMKEIAAINMAKKMGIWEEDVTDKYVGSIPNQIIISGTADYDFKHFAEYWKKWHSIITSKGKNKDPEDKTNWKDYSIIRIPYKLVPQGFMDEDQVARSRATVHTGVFEMEYGAVFSKDSSGFYKRTLIEQCVVSNNTDWSKMPEGAAIFQATLVGDSKKTYILAVDPASESDNFSIAIIELHETHRRIVYCWVTTAKEHAERIRMQLSTESDFYSYCCRKIRDLMKVFPCERIVIDGQGGGKAVIEGLHDKDKMEAGEQQLWHAIDPDERRDSDGYAGQHVIIEIQFANADWTTYANTGMRKDFEDKVLLFPFFDPVTLSISSIEDERQNRIFDTLEDCVINIEELKNELTTIVMTSTPGGNRDRWDTPEIKLPGSKKGRMRKDRYSALLMANAVGRQIQRLIKKPIYVSEGGFANEFIPERPVGPDYVGPAWFTEKMRDVY